MPSDDEPERSPKSNSCAANCQDQLDRGATRAAFSLSFALAALLGLLALIPIALSRRVEL